ncbi:secretin N-terminal domain-containing protein [Lentisphaerota bacterium WC36G]|nr:hypothetical protein LJT99_02010 [Lentisphaerae bacterium WC36]
MKGFKQKFCNKTLVVFFFLTLWGCQLPKTEIREKIEKVEKIEEVGSFFENRGGRLIKKELGAMKDEQIYPVESAQYLRVKNLATPKYRTTPELEANIGLAKLPFELNDDDKKKRMFNFSEASFDQIIPLFAKELGFQYILEENINVKTTMFCEMDLTSQEVWDIFQQIMVNANLYYTIQNDLLVIRPMMDAGKASTIQEELTNLGVQIFFLKYVDSKNMASQLAPFISKGVKVIELPSQNAIMLMDNKDVIQKIKRIISYIDQPSQNNWFKTVVKCDNVSSKRIAEELGQLLPVLGFPISINNAKDSAENMKVTSIDRLQILILSSPTEGALNEAIKWIEHLDSNDANELEQVYVYNVMNSTADSLSEVLSVLFSLQGTVRTPDITTSENRSQGGIISSVKSISSKAASILPSGKGAVSSSDKVASSDSGCIFDNPVRVYADGVNNSLTIRTRPRTYAMIKAILDRHDILPKQVLIQVLVIEVNLTDSLKFGVEFSLMGNGNPELSGGTNYKNLNPGVANEYGGDFWIYDPQDPSQQYGYVQALSGITDVKVLSSPQILVVSHSQAKIAVGNMVPLVNSEITNSQSAVSIPTTNDDTASTSLVRNINYEDTGIILKIIPQVTHSGRITLIMDQTVSEAIVNRTSNIDSPEIQNRIVQTTMLIKDGQTVLCGGIIRERATDNLDTIPFLAQIPFIRRLVGDTNYQKERSEMLILVTGSIITDNNKLQDLVNQYRQTISSLHDFHNKKSILKDENNFNTVDGTRELR